jgi:hypothetical protein
LSVAEPNFRANDSRREAVPSATAISRQSCVDFVDFCALTQVFRWWLFSTMGFPVFVGRFEWRAACSTEMADEVLDHVRTAALPTETNFPDGR